MLGESKPYSICGSLPLVGDLQEAGFDVQVGLAIAGVSEAGLHGGAAWAIPLFMSGFVVGLWALTFYMFSMMALSSFV